MATETLEDVELSGAWVDIVAAVAEADSVDVRVQNVEKGRVAVVSGGAAEPVGMSGTVLGPLDSVQVNSDHIWARAIDGHGKASLELV